MPDAPLSKLRASLVVHGLQLVLLAALTLGGFSAYAQTTLSEGDIAFTYLQDGEKYSFVLLRDVDFGTQVVVMSNGAIITGWTAPIGGASAGDVITVSTSDAKAEGVVAFYGGAGCAYTGLAQISPKGFNQTSDECSLSTGQSIDWNNEQTVWYTGPRTGLTAAEYLDEFNDSSNWESDDDNDEDQDDTTSFSIESSGSGSGSGGSGSGGGENLNTAVTSIYTQDFQSYSPNVTTPSDGAWTLSTPSQANLWATATANTGAGQIVFAGIDTDGNATWTSEDIDISGYTGIELAIDLYENGNQNNDDYIDVSVIVDGSTTSLYSVFNDFGSTSQSGLSVSTGTTLNVKVTVNNDNPNEEHFFDNISVTGTASCSTSISSVTGSTVVLDGSGSGTVTASSSNVTATDGCGTGLSYYVSTSVSGPFNSSTVDVDCTDLGALTLYFQVADGSGNTSNVESASFTISDSTAPSTPSVSVSDIAIDADGTTTIAASTYASGSTDNCSSQGLTYLVSTNGSSGFATTLDVTCSDLGALTLYFRAEDSSGNQSSSTLAGNGAFTVVDNIAPTITAVTPTTVNLTDGAAMLDVSSLTFTASDNCTSSGSLTYTVSTSSGGSFGSSVALDCTGIPSQTLYFKATDASGNASAEFSQAFTVNDATAPTISSTSGATVNLDGAGSVTVTASSSYVTATDDCSTGGELSYLVSDAADGTYAGTIDLSCSDLGANTLYFKVQDAAGNLSSASSASVTVADVTDPTVTASDQSLDLTGASVTLLASTVVSSSSDNCAVTATEIKLTSAGDGAYATSIDFTSGDTYSVTVRVSDASGNTATATATVTVTEVLYSEDFEDFPDNYGFGSGGSNSGGYPNDVDQDWTISGTPTDNWWVEDISGNKLFEGKELDGECVWNSPTIDVAGKTSLNLTMDLSEDAGSNDLEDADYLRVYVKYNGGSETLLLGTSDDYDTIALDESLSDATNIQFVVRADCDGNGEHHRFDNLRLTGVQGCTAIAVSASPVTVDLASNGEVAVTASTVSASSTGDCFTVSSYEVSKDGGSYGSSVTYDCTETGAQTLYVRATDGASTSDPTTVTVTVQDVTVPTISSVSGGSIELDANGDGVITASTTYVSGAADNCSGQGLTYLVSDASDGTYAATLALTCSDLSGKDVYFKVQDASGNLSAAAGPASFTVTDNTAPTYTTTGGTFNLSGGSVVVTFADVTTGLTDACDASPTTEVSKNNSTWSSSVSYDCSDAGTSPTLYVRAADASGNVNQTSVSISIADNTTPVITAVSPTSVQLSTGAATVSISGLTITASDDCTSSGALTYTVSTASDGTYGSSVDFDCTDIGTVPLFFKAEDAAGNLSAAFEQDFTVTDATGLTAIGQDIQVALASDGTYALAASEVDNGSVGNCNTSLSVSPSSFTCDDLGANVVTLTITDSTNGASDNTTVTVTVVDETAPVINALASVAKNLDAVGAGTIVPTDAGALASPADACTVNGSISFQIKREGDASFGSSVSVSCSDVGVGFNVILQATDAEGNASTTGNIPVTVSDVTAPTISDVTVGLTEALGSDGAATISAVGYVTASDNCTASGSLTYEISETSGSGFASTFAADCADIGSKTFYFRVTDAAGLTSAESSESITIADNISPTATAVDRVLILTGASVSLSASDANFNTSTDNCSFTSLVKLTSAGDGTYASSIDFSSVGSYSVTLKVTDAGGNVSTDTATITVTSEPDEVTLYTEDFEDDVLENGQNSYPSFCAQGITEAHDGNWRLSCGDGLLTVFPYNGTTDDGFNWYSGAGSVTGDWFSDTIDVSSILTVDATLDIYELNCGGCGSEGLTLYTILDGGTAVQQDTETGNFNAGTLTITDLSTASASTLVLKVSGMGMTGADLFLTNVSVTGTCIDLDGNGICDDDQNCVDVPAGTCGCTDKTACTYSATASTNDPDSCQYVGYECQDPSGTTGYTWTLSAGSCSCSSADFNTLFFEDFGSGGEAGGQGSGYGYDGYEQLTNVTGTDVNVASGVGTDGWFLEFDDANVGDGTLNGTEPDYFITYYTLSTAGSITQAYSADVADTSMWANYTVSGVRWVSKLLNVGDYSDLRLSTDLFGQQGNTSDYVGVRLGDNRMPFAWTAATGATNSFTTFTKDLQVDVDTIRIQVDIDANAASSFHALDDVVLSAWGKGGCTDSEATNYDSTAQVDDGSCTGITFATAYSRYDGGFSDKIWAGTACGGDCGSAPYPDAKSLAALAQTSSTTFDYVVSSGTTVTVDGTTPVASNASLQDLFVNDLTIESGGSLVIPEGKRIRVMGTFTDQDGTGVTGDGRLCIDGTFAFDSQSSFTDISVADLQLPQSAVISVPEGKNLNVTGDLFFGSAKPNVSGKITLNGSSAQAISGDGAAFDELVISNTSGVTSSDSLEIAGRLTLKESSGLSMGANWLTFSSTNGAGGTDEEKTGVLDAIPSSATLTGQSNASLTRVRAERFIAADSDGSTNFGYTAFGSPIQGVTASDLNDIEGFTSAGWDGSDNPNASSNILLWNESGGNYSGVTSSTTSLGDQGNLLFLDGNQTPVIATQGPLYNHHLDGDSKSFQVTRSGSNSTLKGWNLVFNPYQARLDWDLIIDAETGNSSVVEDQYVIFDTQLRRNRRYGVNTANVDWSNDTEAGEDSVAMQYINPGQAFWVRVKDGVSSGLFTLSPSMIDNTGSATEFIRNAEEGAMQVIMEVENGFGATRFVLNFNHFGCDTAYVDGDMSFFAGAVNAGEGGFLVGDQRYVAKSLPLEGCSGEIYVESLPNWPTTMRVVEVTGNESVCAYITDTETGNILTLNEGNSIDFTQSSVLSPGGRFLLESVPFAQVEGLSPACEGDEMGALVLELGDVVADVNIMDVATMEMVGQGSAWTGTVEVEVPVGQYTVMVLAEEGTSVCKSARREADVFPPEEPELLTLEALPAECNAGLAAVEFELYGGGTFNASMWLDGDMVWQEDVYAGEYVYGDFEPGVYDFKVEHPCYTEWDEVELVDENMPLMSVEYDEFVYWDGDGAWLEAICEDCPVEADMGYYWMVDGVVFNVNEPLSVRVDALGAYAIELLAFGPGCEVGTSFEIQVGKPRISSPNVVRWLGVVDNHLGVVFDEEWLAVEARWIDATGRVVARERIGSAVGEHFMVLPDMIGWATLELRSAEGQVVRWLGIL